jgi:hypothetical protein
MNIEFILFEFFLRSVLRIRDFYPGSRFRRLEKKLSTRPTLCSRLYNEYMEVNVGVLTNSIYGPGVGKSSAQPPFELGFLPSNSLSWT